MKGIIIYEDYRGKKVVEAVKLGAVNYTCKSEDSDWVSELSGIRKESTQAYCNKDDTYDFEVGALIALMKMCGAKKSAEACCEAFPHETSGSIYRENKRYIKRIKGLEEENETLKKEKEQIIVAKNVLYNKLEKENKDLHKDIDELCENDTYRKSEVARLSFEKHRLEEKVEKLQHDYDLCKNSENALKCSVDYLNKSIAKLNTAIYGYKEDLNKVAERCRELEEENEKLKLDCEMLQHGYLDTDMIFCGGRQNGKQYTLLVDLFKKIDQKKVDAAYKEAYNTTLPVWQKEALRQAYEIRKESKEKTVWLTSQSFTRDYLDSLLESSKYAIPYTTEWIKPLTKREKMWEKIFALHKKNDVIIVVEKEDVDAFLHEIENRIPEIRWASWQKIFEAKGTIKDIYGALKTCDRIYFRLQKYNDLSFSSDPHIYRYRDLEHISYLPPMRWDLFKKGRIAVKVDYDNHKEFYEACKKELGKRPLTNFACIYTVSICKKDGLFEIFTIEDQKKTGRKIVDWEDVK